METGTLKELNVKPGDVVELEGCYGEKMTVTSCPPRPDYFGDHWEIDCEKSGVGLYSPYLKFRIISRASDPETPKLWRDMNPEKKSALLLAHHEGKVIQLYDGGVWCDTDDIWWGKFAYRVRPEPTTIEAQAAEIARLRDSTLKKVGECLAGMDHGEVSLIARQKIRGAILAAFAAAEEVNMTQIEALRELKEAVEAGRNFGSISGSLIMKALGLDNVKLCGIILFPEYDIRKEGAARALHDAVLPGWPYTVENVTGHTYRVWTDKSRNLRQPGFSVRGPCPARAWLLAIITALIAQEEFKND